MYCTGIFLIKSRVKLFHNANRPRLLVLAGIHGNRSGQLKKRDHGLLRDCKGQLPVIRCNQLNCQHLHVLILLFMCL